MTTFEVLKQYFKCFDIKGSAVNPLGVLRNWQTWGRDF